MTPQEPAQNQFNSTQSPDPIPTPAPDSGLLNPAPVVQPAVTNIASPSVSPVTSVNDPGKDLGIAGLISALLMPPVGFVISLIALKKSQKAGQKNTPALIGLIIGGAWLAMIVLFITLGFLSAARG